MLFLIVIIISVNFVYLSKLNKVIIIIKKIIIINIIIIIINIIIITIITITIKMYFIQTPIIKLTTNSTNFSGIILYG